MFTNETIKDLRKRLEALRRFLDIDQRKEEVKELEKESQQPEFWNDPQKAESVLKTIKGKNEWIKAYDTAQTAFEELKVIHEFYEEKEADETDLKKQYDKTLKEIGNLEFLRMLSKDEDKLSAILEINPGAGGTESQDWAEMLMRMYIRWGERHNYKVKELDLQEGEVAGIKSVSIEFEGEFAFGYLKGENGVHRLVRISPFDANKRRHTSFASVYVYPVVDENIKIEINPSDISWDTFRSSGPGGQNVNKLETAVRLRYQPEDIVIECQETRSQSQNREKALRMLKSKLYEIEMRKKQEAQAEIEGAKKKIEWGSQIRSYVMQPYTLVKDTRTNTEVGNVQAVLDGEIDEFLKAYLMEFGGE
ncbi:MAG: peptide chain release factor 2 [Bacteroidales bacterium]|nr:peptide chain release factor 2 [Bacteroidales bacterium]MCF8345318.1 peptide chain release factor 2 [Bacteroidales bacterium]MCF8351609.1 peptide chain release factor 2 [Bacteroidales bacterium]MCF8376398.1 peptide chain release factor 2 [Bacteroidales bacterium]MCF8401218.1 peptide chain release factor 2 [Bacteroidales bacterium]